MSAMEKKQGKKGFFSPIVKYFKEVKSELKKVVFPTAKQTRINTTIVILVVIIVGLLIAGLDFAFNSARNAIIAEKPEKATTEDISMDDIMQQQPQTQMPTAEEAQAMLDEYNSYTVNEEGNYVDANGDVVMNIDGQPLTKEELDQQKAGAQAIIDAANAEAAPQDAPAEEVAE